MDVTITREQRRALLMAALDEASIAGETLATLVWRPDLTEALATRQRLDDATRLIDDLHWETQSTQERYALTMRADQARRVLETLRAAAQDDLRDLAQRQRMSRHAAGDDDEAIDFELANLDLDVCTACEAALAQLAGNPAVPS
jgi:hypothetical protein